MLRLTGSWKPGGGSNLTSKEGFFAHLKNTITTFFSNLVKIITDFFKKHVEDNADRIRPENGSEKIEINSNNEKLVKTCDETLRDLDKCKSEEDVQKTMEKHRKRKKALKAAVIIGTITAAAGFGYVQHCKSQELKECKVQKTALEKELSKQEKTVQNLVSENSELVRDLMDRDKTIYDMKHPRRMQQEASATQREVINCATAITKAKLEVINDKSNARIEQAGQIVKQLESKKSEAKEAIKETGLSGKKLDDSIIRRARMILKSPNASKQEKDRAAKFLMKIDSEFRSSSVNNKYF